MENRTASQGSSTDGAPVPFIGWSRAAAQFRNIAAENAARFGTSILLLGPLGVGKKTMAKDWRLAAGVCADVMPTVDLDTVSDDIPNPCIATSTRPLPRDLHCLHLGTGQCGPIVRTASAAAPLSSELAGRFAMRLYMPSLRERPIDILAILHFYNCYLFPKQLGCTYSQISTRLLYSMMFETDWPSNCLGVIDYLKATMVRDSCRKDRPLSSSSADLGLLQTNPDLPMFHPGAPIPKPKYSDYVRWGSDDVELPFDQLPELAVWIYRRQWEEGEYGENPLPLGLDEFRNRENGLSVEAFLKVSVEDFVHEPWPAGVKPSGRGLIADEKPLYDKERRREVLGATFDSLRSGLAVRVKDVIKLYTQDELAPVRGSAGPAKRRKRRKHRQQTPLTPVQKELLQLHYGQRLSIKEISKERNCSVQNVSQILKTAMEKLPKRSRSVNAGRLDVDRRGQETVVDQSAEE